jgi:hypothetical protein
MTDQVKSMADDDSIAEVRNAYREVATESTPEALDRWVLKKSRESVRGWSFRLVPHAWARPTALAAMAALCVFAVLQLRAPDEVTARKAVQPIEADSSGIARESVNDFSEAVESTGQHLRELDSAAESLVSNNKPSQDPVPSTGDQPTIAAQTGASAPGHCDASIRESPESWWQCIQALDRNGMIDAARTEKELLQATYSSFEPAQ